MHKATQTNFQHIKVVPYPPDLSPLLQRCLARFLGYRAKAPSNIQDPSLRMTSWLAHLPQGRLLTSLPSKAEFH